MSCDNVITVQDLETDKKHSTFYREVITGKVGGTGADIDFATNAVTGQLQKTLTKAILDVGVRRVGDFTSGCTVLSRSDGVLNVGDSVYVWLGALPKSVTPNSTPESSGGIGDAAWLDIGDASLRSDLSQPEGVSLVGNAADKRGDNFSGMVSAVGLSSLTKYGGVIVGDNPIGVTGSDWPSSASLRDAINVSRNLANSPTDCHAFSDKTVIDNPSDYGGYGAFDATTILRGSGVVNHVASFQARTQYQGSGTLENMWGIIILPTSTNASTIKSCIGARIEGVSGQSLIEKNIGIEIKPLSARDENVGVKVFSGESSSFPAISFKSMQNAGGYGYYAASSSYMYNSGKSFFGSYGADGANPAVTAETKFEINVKGAGGPSFGLTTDSGNGAAAVVSGDSKISWISNSSLLGYWGNSSDSRSFIANSNTQSLGVATKRWNTVYLVTAPNVSSDERTKTFEDVSDIEASCARALKRAFRKYRLKSGVSTMHFGVSAQSIVKIFSDFGLNAEDYNIVSVDKDGNYSVVYEELFSMMMVA